MHHGAAEMWIVCKRGRSYQHEQGRVHRQLAGAETMRAPVGLEKMTEIREVVCCREGEVSRGNEWIAEMHEYEQAREQGRKMCSKSSRTLVTDGLL